jgi:hypothetical protein
MTIRVFDEQSNPSASADYIEENCNDGDDQQGVNESACTVCEEANQPAEDEQHGNNVQ